MVLKNENFSDLNIEVEPQQPNGMVTVIARYKSYEFHSAFFR